jgi:hypothetical protein
MNEKSAPHTHYQNNGDPEFVAWKARTDRKINSFIEALAEMAARQDLAELAEQPGAERDTRPSKSGG